MAKKHNSDQNPENNDKQDFLDKGTLMPGAGGASGDSVPDETPAPAEDSPEATIKKKKSTLQPLPKAKKDPDAALKKTVLSDIDFSDPGEENFSKTMNPEAMMGRQATDWSRLLDEIRVDDVEEKTLPPLAPGPGSPASGKKTTSGKPPRKPTSGASPKADLERKKTTHSLDGILKVRTRPVSGGEPFHPEANPDYEVLSKLQEGGMGVVYIAKQTSLNRELAFKTLKPLSEAQKKAFVDEKRETEIRHQRQEMFLSEAVVTANLVHPNIVPIHDLGRTSKGIPFYSMKLVEGTPWEERLTKMSVEENLDILLKVCDAVAYSHHNGVINRDLKPENVMLGEFGEVIVLDWGLAVQAPDAVSKVAAAGNATTLGAGTALYMAPEMMKGPAVKIGRCSDIYLLGGILFEIVTGNPPHAAEASYEEMFRAISDNKIQPTDVTGELVDIAYKALETEPEDRYHSVQELQLAIRTYQRHEESRHLTIRGDELVATAEAKPDNYSEYQNAVALYGEALRAWPENKEATRQLSMARLGYAESARKSGDFDLGLQVTRGEDSKDFVEVRKKLQSGLRKRATAKYTILGSILALFIGGAAFTTYAINAEKNAKAQLAENERLNGTNEQLEKSSAEAVARADSAKAEADERVASAKAREQEADGKVKDAETALDELNNQLATAEMATRMAKMEKETAETAKIAAEAAKTEAEVAAKNALTLKETAEQQTAMAKRDLVAAKKQMESAVDLQKAAEKNASRTAVQSDIAVALRDIEAGDYTNAIEKIDTILNGDSIDKLEPDVAKRRRTELKGRLNDLKRRAAAPSVAPIQSGAISRDGKTVVSGTTLGDVSVFTVLNGEIEKAPKATFNADAAVEDVAISDDGSVLCVTSGSEILGWKNGKKIEYESGTATGEVAANICCVRIHKAGDQSWLVSGSENGLVLIHDLETGAIIGKTRSAPVRDIVVLPKQRMIVVAGSRGNQSVECTAYTISADGKTIKRHSALDMRGVRVRNPISGLALTRDGSFLAMSNSNDGTMIVLPKRPTIANKTFPFFNPYEIQKKTGTRNWQFKAHVGPVTDFTFSTTGNRLVTGSVDQTIKVWDYTANNGVFAPKLVKPLRGHGGPIEACGFLDSTDSLVSMSRDRFVRTWEVSTYDKEQEDLEKPLEESTPQQPALKTPEDTTSLLRQSETLVSFQPNDRRSQVARVELRLPRQKKNDFGATVLNGLVAESETRAHQGTIRSVRISRDGSRVLTGSDDRTARLWDTKTGAPLGGFESPNQRGVFTEGHRFNIESFQFFSDGKRLMTSGYDGSVSIWDAASTDNDGLGYELGRINGVGVQNAAAISNNDETIVTSGYSGGEDIKDKGEVYGLIWKTADVIAGDVEPLGRLTGYHKKRISSVAISPNGKRVATGSIGGAVAIWNTDDLTTIADSRKAHGKTSVTSLTFLDDDRLLTAGADGRIVVRGVENGSMKVIKTVASKKGQIDRVSVSPDGQQLLYVTATEREDLSKEEKQEVSPYTTLHVASLKNDEDSKTIDLSRLQRLLKRDKDAIFEILSIAWSPDEKQVAMVMSWVDFQVPEAGKDRRVTNEQRFVQILDASNWTPVAAFHDREQAAPPLAAIFSPNDDNCLATYDGLTAHLWDLRDGKHKAGFRPHATVFAADFSNDNSLIVTASDAVRVFDADESSPRFGHSLYKSDAVNNGRITDVEFSPTNDSYQFVSARADGVVRVWSWSKDKSSEGKVELVHDLKGHTGSVRQATWSADGKQILSVGNDGQPRIWDLTVKGSKPTVITIAEGIKLTSCDFSNDGEWIAAAGLNSSEESVGWVWNIQKVKDGETSPHTFIKGHRLGGITAISFVADGPYIVTGGNDGAVLMWDWWKDESPKPNVPHVAFESFRLIGEDPSFDTDPGAEDVSFLREAHAGPVTSIDASFPGQIVTGSNDGTAIIWGDPISPQDDAA